jgi:hypothetical protein
MHPTPQRQALWSKRLSFKSHRLIRILCTTLFLVLVSIPVVARGDACPCGPDLFCYEKHHYRVGKIRIETFFDNNVPLDSIFKVQQLLFNQFAQVKTELALKEGELFTREAYNRSVTQLGGRLGTLNVGERFKLVVIEPSLKDCNASALTVDVVYRVFTTDGLSFLTASFERSNDQISRAVLIPIPGSGTNKLLPQPYIGYNSSRGLFGGSRVAFKNTGGILNQVDLDVAGSGSSATVDLGLAGSKTFKESFVNYAQWKLGYSYSNIPTDTIRLKEATLRAQFFGGSRPFGPRGMALRFGASVEGGNRQADLATNASSLPENPTSSPYGAVKAYVGSTMNWGRQSWRASYGLQLGQAEKDVQVDYVKQVGDISYSVRFLPREHRPLRLDVSGSAGRITSRSGLIPVGERFFGGNVKRNFIQGADWEINSSPLIRSFSQNSLNLIGPGLPIGGKHFFSGNLTLAQTIWYHSAVPEELAREPELKIKLNGSITTERESAKGSYLYLAPEFTSLMKDLNDLDELLKKLDTSLDSLKAKQPPPPVLSAIDTFYDLEPNSGYKPLPDSLDAIKTAKQDKTVAIDQSVALAQDVPELSSKAYITVLIEIITAAQAPFAAAGLPTNELTDSITPLKTIQQDMLAKIKRINDLGKYQTGDIQLVTQTVNDLSPILDSINQQLSQLPTPQDQDPVKEYAPKLAAVTRYLAAAIDGVAQVNQDDVTVRGAERLAVGYGEVAGAIITGLVNSIAELQAPLKEKGLVEVGQALAAEGGRLKTGQAQIKERLKQVRVPEIEKKANRDVAFTGRVLDVIFRELNLVSVSPLVMIDVARIGPQANPTYNKLRYGLGGGVRLSLVSLDFDLGYSWNPNRLPGERRGAFVFSLNVSDLFR